VAQCDLAITIDRDPHALRPGDHFAGEVTVAVDADVRCNALTLELRWVTDGKGKENSEVVEAWTLFSGALRTGTRQAFAFATQIPRMGPASYQGKLLRVDWELRARADVPWAIDAKATLPLVVGNRAAPEVDATERAGEGCDSHEDEDDDEGASRSPELKLVVPGRGTTRDPRPGLVIAAMMAVALGIGLAAGLWRPVWGMVRTLPRLVRGDLTWADSPELIFGTLILVVAAALAWAIAREVLVVRRLGEVHCEIAPELARPGDEVRCLVRFTPRASFQLSGITAHLRAAERCERGSGRGRKVYKHLAIDHVLELSPARAVSPGLPYEARGALQIPADAPPTFSSSDNHLEWRVDVAIRIPRWPDWKKKAFLHVIP
jgi:hypothetical protein